MTRTVFVVACVTWIGLSRGTLPAAAVDPITEWSVTASSAASASAMAPLRTPITLAMLHLAMYDAVNAVVPDRTSYAARVAVARPASADAAAIEAGYRILLAEFPGQQAIIDAKYQTLLADVSESTAKRNGIAAGASVAQQLLVRRANDGRNARVPYAPGVGPGVWVPTPPGFLAATTAFLARVSPFTMDSPWQFRPEGPPALGSMKWVRDYNEVKVFGVKAGSARSDEQTATALFWEPLAGTVWPATIRRIARERAFDLGSSAWFQAAAFAAFADGLIACWDAKFAFNSWRPVTAIQQGASDGNSRTDAEPAWEPLAVTPNFPEYPSGHACATAAVAHTIEDALQREGLHHLRIPARHFMSGEERFYRRASDVVDEVVEARMWLGLHFRSADEDGADIGRRIANQLRNKFFKREPLLRGQAFLPIAFASSANGTAPRP